MYEGDLIILNGKKFKDARYIIEFIPHQNITLMNENNKDSQNDLRLNSSI